MNGSRCVLAIILFVAVRAETRAQFFVPAPLPHGISFHFHGRHVHVSGFYSASSPYAYCPPPYYGIIENHVFVQAFAPTLIVRPRVVVPFAEEIDVSGIDLDREPPARLFGDNPPPGVAARPIVARRPDAPALPIEAPAAKKPVKKAPAPPPVEPPVVVKDETQRLLDLGRRAFQQEEYGVALLRFRQATLLAGTNAKAFFLFAQAQLALGQYRDAAETIQEGLRLQPDWPTTAFLPRLELYADDVRDWQVHRERLEEAHKRQPKNGDYLFLLGYVAWFNGERPEAGAWFRQARPLLADPRGVDLFLKVAPPPIVAG